jgi:hypothetical protein
MQIGDPELIDVPALRRLMSRKTTSTTLAD